MQHLDGSGAWPSYIYDARFLKVKEIRRYPSGQRLCVF
jgi:hypothetical protein